MRSFVAAGAGAVAAPARQLLMCLTMLFMLAVAGGPATSAAATMPGTDMAGMDMSGAAPSGATPAAVLPVLLLGLLALAGGWHAREITRAVASGDAWHLRGPTGESGARHLLLARGPSLGCQLAMTAAMGFMLVPMVR